MLLFLSRLFYFESTKGSIMSEKLGIFCSDCPIRRQSRLKGRGKPTNLGASQPVSPTTARHYLGHSVPAVQFQTVDAEAAIVGGNSTVVVPAAISAREVAEAFAGCSEPVPNTVRVIGLRIPLGQKCMGLVALDEQMHWSATQESSPNIT